MMEILGSSFIDSIIPKVSWQPINWTCNEVLFPTGHGPFPSLLSIECNSSDPIPKFRPAFSQIAASVTDHPLPPVMGKFKTTQTSTVHTKSSSLPHQTIPFLEMEDLVSPFQQSTLPPLQPIIP
ncbi:hypothetical protein AVEN_89601-1 [Araneus ventricosus]|uniref:Uncharacterized protein n=1 Tax=Araneus ventricosus TaxID=182803 RepID=A0A4Y2JXB6_ARAVE|nr:hypothetical protein AVEN_89601-1 [Araneus ventricosus]